MKNLQDFIFESLVNEGAHKVKTREEFIRYATDTAAKLYNFEVEQEPSDDGQITLTCTYPGGSKLRFECDKKKMVYDLVCPDGTRITGAGFWTSYYAFDLNYTFDGVSAVEQEIEHETDGARINKLKKWLRFAK